MGSNKFGFKILAAIIFILLVFDMMLAPILSALMLQYPELFEVISPTTMFIYITIIEILINVIIMFLVYMVNKRKR